MHVLGTFFCYCDSIPTLFWQQNDFHIKSNDQAQVVQTLDSAIHWVNHYPADKYWVN